MAKQLYCLAARQSRAAKSFLAFRHHIVIIGVCMRRHLLSPPTGRHTKASNRAQARISSSLAGAIGAHLLKSVSGNRPGAAHLSVQCCMPIIYSYLLPKQREMAPPFARSRFLFLCFLHSDSLLASAFLMPEAWGNRGNPGRGIPGFHGNSGTRPFREVSQHREAPR